MHWNVSLADKLYNILKINYLSTGGDTIGV